MKRLFFLSLTFLSLSSYAIIPFVHLELYGAVDFGDYSQKEDDGRYNHDAWTYGAEVGTRIGLDVFGVMAGGLYSLSKHHFDSDREDTQATQNQIQGYNNNWNTTLTGIYAGFRIPVLPVRIWGEYYIKARSVVGYAGPDAENPYSKEEAVEGSGFAGGVALELGFYYAGLLLRRLKYNKFGIESGNFSSGSEFGKKTVNMTSFQLGMFF